MLITFLGAGNLATSLAPALAENGHKIVQVFSRTLESACILVSKIEGGISSVCDLNGLFLEADMFVYALPDDVIPVVAQQVAELLNRHRSTVNIHHSIHCHTSGSVPIEALSQYFGHSAVLYPSQTFKRSQRIDLKHVPFFIEASDRQTEEAVVGLARNLSDEVYLADTNQRKHLHIACVFANNFTNCMYAIAKEELEKAGLPFKVLYPLIEQTARKVLANDPHEIQTGPASRGDMQTVATHLSMLEGYHKEIYRVVTDEIRSWSLDN